MRILLDGVPFGAPDIHFDSRANIIVTNAKLQASRVGVFFAQRWPRRESMLASDHRLRIVPRQIGCVNLIDGYSGERWQDGEAVERLSIAGLGRM
jgi:hypothetical protein